MKSIIQFLLTSTLLVVMGNMVFGLATVDEERRIRIPFEYEKVYVTSEIEKLCFQNIQQMEAGEERELVLYSEKEEKKIRTDVLVGLTKRRADRLTVWMKNMLLIYDIQLETKFYPLEAKNSVHAGSNTSYRSHTSRYGLYSLVVSKAGDYQYELSMSDLPNGTADSSTFIINQEEPNVFYGKQGTALYFPEDCFEENCDEINVVLYEYLQTSDWLQNDLLTISGRTPLTSGGMVNVKVYCDGKLLTETASKYQIFLPTDTIISNLELFIGKQEKERVNWRSTRVPARNVNLAANEIPAVDNAEAEEMDWEVEDVFSKSDYLVLSTTKLGWINCDKFQEYDKSELYDFVVKVPEGITPAVRLILKDDRSLLPGYFQTKNKRIVSFSDVPKGKSAKLWCYKIEESDNMVWFDELTIKTGKNLMLEMNPKKITMAEFKEKLLAN